MRREFVLLRKAAIVIVAGASVTGAVGLIWILLTQGELPSLTTLQLLGMLALFLLPGATFVAWHWDRAAAHESAPSSDLFETPEGVEVVEEAEAPPARDIPRGMAPGRAAAAADQPPPHRRRNHTVRHKAERD